ncbi:hypothetical protein glysoja_014264 [Glycine soja]|nr:hypothetical protein glysoja_014264 [Glycine soja]
MKPVVVPLCRKKLRQSYRLRIHILSFLSLPFPRYFPLSEAATFSTYIKKN